jgi:hypothetical protein
MEGGWSVGHVLGVPSKPAAKNRKELLRRHRRHAATGEPPHFSDAKTFG